MPKIQGRVLLSLSAVSYNQDLLGMESYSCPLLCRLLVAEGPDHAHLNLSYLLATCHQLRTAFSNILPLGPGGVFDEPQPILSSDLTFFSESGTFAVSHLVSFLAGIVLLIPRQI